MFVLIHPINTEVANWVTTELEILYGVFVLLATAFYIKFRQAEANRKKAQSVWSQHKNLFLAALFYLVAMLFKEPAILFPAMALSLDVLVFRRSPRSLLRSREWKPYLVLGGTWMVYMIMRFAAGGGAPKPQPFYDFSLGERIYAFFDLFSHYISSMVYPFPLLVFHPFEKSSDFFSISFILSAFGVLLYVGLMYLLYRRQKFTHVFFSIWFFVFLFPALFFVRALGENVFSERYALVPMVGFAFLLAALILAVHSRLSQKKKILLWFIVGVLVVVSEYRMA